MFTGMFAHGKAMIAGKWRGCTQYGMKAPCGGGDAGAHTDQSMVPASVASGKKMRFVTYLHYFSLSFSRFSLSSCPGHPWLRSRQVPYRLRRCGTLAMTYLPLVLLVCSSAGSCWYDCKSDDDGLTAGPCVPLHRIDRIGANGARPRDS